MTFGAARVRARRAEPTGPTARRPSSGASTRARLTRRAARPAVGVREASSGARARLGVAPEVGRALLRQAVRRQRLTATRAAHQAGSALAAAATAVALIGREFDARAVALHRRARAPRAGRSRSASGASRAPCPHATGSPTRRAPTCGPSRGGRGPGSPPPGADAHRARLIALTRRARIPRDPTRLAERPDLTAIVDVTAARARGLTRSAKRGPTPGPEQHRDEEDDSGAQARDEGTAPPAQQGFDVHAR